MRGSRLLVTSSAGGAGRFCGRVLWRTCIGGVTEYEALMGGHASREKTLRLLRGMGALGAMEISREREHLFLSFFDIGIGSMAVNKARGAARQGVVGNRGHHS